MLKAVITKSTSNRFAIKVTLAIVAVEVCASFVILRCVCVCLCAFDSYIQRGEREREISVYFQKQNKQYKKNKTMKENPYI